MMPSEKPPLRVLVTGGAGFIGTHFCREASAKGWDVTVLDLNPPREAVAGVRYVHGDILDDALVASLVGTMDEVVHLAAKVSVPLCNLDPVGSYTTNLLGTVKIVDALARANRARPPSFPKIALYFASSAAVYGNEGDRGILDESDVAKVPLSHYAHQKRACEGVLALSAADVPSLSFRFFNVYGIGQDPNSPYSGVISVFSELLRAGKPLKLFGDGSQTRDFVAVEDIVRGLIRALELPAAEKDGSAMNLCTGSRITVREIGETIARVLDVRLAWIAEPSRPGDVRHSSGNYGRAEKILGWSPRVSLEAGLRGMLTIPA